MLRRSHYLTLGVAPNETTREIRVAFLQLVKRYHPDRLGPEREPLLSKNSRSLPRTCGSRAA